MVVIFFVALHPTMVKSLHNFFSTNIILQGAFSFFNKNVNSWYVLTIFLLKPQNILSMFFNPLTANDELSRHEILTFLWTWTLKWVPRSFATHASLCNTLSSHKLSKNSERVNLLRNFRLNK